MERGLAPEASKKEAQSAWPDWRAKASGEGESEGSMAAPDKRRA